MLHVVKALYKCYISKITVYKKLNVLWNTVLIKAMHRFLTIKLMKFGKQVLFSSSNYHLFGALEISICIFKDIISVGFTILAFWGFVVISSQGLILFYLCHLISKKPKILRSPFFHWSYFPGKDSILLLTVTYWRTDMITFKMHIAPVKKVTLRLLHWFSFPAVSFWKFSSFTVSKI